MTQDPTRPTGTPEPWSAQPDSTPTAAPPPPIEPPPAYAPPVAPPPVAPPPAPANQGGKWRALIPIAVIVGILGVVLYVTRDNQAADALAVGTCFDVPSEETLNTVATKPCTEAHDAEVFHTLQYTGDTSTYPITTTWDTYISEACDPVFGTYTGTDILSSEELTYGWFYPTRDGWDDGGRTITCYVTRVDEAKLTQSIKAG